MQLLTGGRNLRGIIGLMLLSLMASCSSSGRNETEAADSAAKTDSLATKEQEGFVIGSPQGNPYDDLDAKVTKRGFIIMGEPPQTRAFISFHGRDEITSAYLKTVEAYREAFPDINLYAGVIPGAAAYYVPKKVAESSKPMKPAFDYLRSHLPETVKYVDIYNQLAAHTNENIFTRTDHHWAPLGAYYAAQVLADAAGVPFKDLSNFDEHVIHGYVGSMTKYTGDAGIKNSPEDFIYYTPKDTEITTYYTTFKVDEETGKITQRGPSKGGFFREYGDGSNGAYCTFMGGDHCLVKVETPVKNGRRLLIVKDSHGNPIPAYLFNSFEEIHVVDYRYNNQNMKDYVAKNKITDLALIFGINTSGSSAAMQNVRTYLTQTPETAKAYIPGKRK